MDGRRVGDFEAGVLHWQRGDQMSQVALWRYTSRRSLKSVGRCGAARRSRDATRKTAQ